MVFPERQPAFPPIDFGFTRRNLFPGAVPERPRVIVPTKYAVQDHKDLSERLKFYLQRIWFFIRKWLRQEAIWIRDLGSIYRDGFFKSSIPAANVLSNPQRQPIRKLLWCLVLSPLIYLTISDLSDVISGYLQYPVIYTYEYRTNNTLDFPDVTICNVNPLLKSEACNRSSILWRRMTITDEDERYTVTPFCTDYRRSFCYRLCGRNQTSRTPNVLDFRIRTELSAWIKETVALGRGAAREIRKIGHKIENLVQKCSYASNDDCSQNLTRFTHSVDQLYGSCYCFHCEARDDWTVAEDGIEELSAEAKERIKELDLYYEYGTLSSPLGGLVLELSTELQDYLPTSHEAGFVAMLRAHNKDYSICQDSIYIMPGFTTYVGLSLGTTQNLGSPYENSCRPRWPSYLRKGVLDAHVQVIPPATQMSQYNRQMCLLYCEIEYLIYRCKCIKNNPAVKVHPNLVEDYKYCRTLKKKKCAANALRDKTNQFWHVRCDCRPECEAQRFATDISVSGFVPEGRELNFTTPGDDFEQLSTDMGYARLVVYFHSFTYENIRAIKKYDEVRVLSNIGGINGMYLGLSFYLIFQAVDVLIVGAIQFVKNIHRHKFLFGHNGHLLTSTGVQTSSQGEREEPRGWMKASMTIAARQEPSFQTEPRKNIWDVFAKPSESTQRSQTFIEPFDGTRNRFRLRQRGDES